MSFDIELYRGKRRRYYDDHEFKFETVVRRAARQHFGDRAEYSQIKLDLNSPRDSEPYTGPPVIHNLAEHGYCRVRLLKGGAIIDKKEMRVTEFLGPVLAEALLTLEPHETDWGFKLRQRRSVQTLLVLSQELLSELNALNAMVGHIEIDHITIDDERPAPEAKGTVDIDLTERVHRPFTLTPVTDDAAARVSPADLGIDPEHLGPINILMSAAVRNQFLHDMPLSDRLEEGGFLLGRVHEAEPGTSLVEVTHVTPAHHSGAGPVHFTFTGESFLAAAQYIGERGLGEELVGWYHTHLFGVELDMGLSSVDVDLHRATFQRPWQVAALINLEKDERVLRFYGRGKDGLTECSQWIADDSGKYRAADSALGDG